jgi:hypothetical protein
MVVTRNADGSHTPAYDETWPEHIQVEWSAGCAAVETGLRIHVTRGSDIQGGVPRPSDAPETYHFRIQGERSSFGTGNMTAQEAYRFLDGVRAGVAATRAS